MFFRVIKFGSGFGRALLREAELIKNQPDQCVCVCVGGLQPPNILKACLLRDVCTILEILQNRKALPITVDHSFPVCFSSTRL